MAFLRQFHSSDLDRMCGYRRAYGLPSCRHHSEEVDEQHWKGATYPRNYPTIMSDSSNCRLKTQRILTRSSSGTRPTPRSVVVSFLSSPVSATLPHTRCSSEYTSLADSPLYGTTSRTTTVTASTAHSARATARPSCTQLQVPLSVLVRSFSCHWTYSRSSDKQTPRLSEAVVWSRLSQTKDLDCTVVGDGPQHATRQARLRYVSASYEKRKHILT